LRHVFAAPSSSACRSSAGPAERQSIEIVLNSYCVLEVVADMLRNLWGKEISLPYSIAIIRRQTRFGHVVSALGVSERVTAAGIAVVAGLPSRNVLDGFPVSRSRASHSCGVIGSLLFWNPNTNTFRRVRIKKFYECQQTPPYCYRSVRYQCVHASAR
jgi:hypothetical protein